MHHRVHQHTDKVERLLARRQPTQSPSDELISARLRNFGAILDRTSLGPYENPGDSPRSQTVDCKPPTFRSLSMSPRLTPRASFSCFSSLGFCLPTSGSYTFTSSLVAESGWESKGAPSSWKATGCSKDGSSTTRSRCEVPSFLRLSSRMRSIARNASLSSQSVRASSALQQDEIAD